MCYTEFEYKEGIISSAWELVDIRNLDSKLVEVDEFFEPDKIGNLVE